MDFIEKIFGVSPDGGNGTLELLYVLVAVAIVATVTLKIWSKRRGNQPEQ